VRNLRTSCIMSQSKHKRYSAEAVYSSRDFVHLVRPSDHQVPSDSRRQSKDCAFVD
jgi:hypothetical protein